MIRISEAQVTEGMRSAGAGVCLSCGDYDPGAQIEPDSEGFECAICGELAVMGFQDAFIMGHVEIQS